jgi:hypothetical protein
VTRRSAYLEASHVAAGEEEEGQRNPRPSTFMSRNQFVQQQQNQAESQIPEKSGTPAPAPAENSDSVTTLAAPPSLLARLSSASAPLPSPSPPTTPPTTEEPPRPSYISRRTRFQEEAAERAEEKKVQAGDLRGPSAGAGAGAAGSGASLEAPSASSPFYAPREASLSTEFLGSHSGKRGIQLKIPFQVFFVFVFLFFRRRNLFLRFVLNPCWNFFLTYLDFP